MALNQPRRGVRRRVSELGRLARRQPGRARAGELATGTVLVLAYHGLADLPVGSSLRSYSVPPVEFAAQLDTLKRRNYTFIDLTTLLAWLSGEAMMPRRAVLISFDDGYEDLLTVAAPVLAAHGIPAVVFAVAGRLGATNVWEAAPAGDRRRLLDRIGLEKVRALGVDIGAHSLTHPVLTDLSDTDLRVEVAGCREALQTAGLGRAHAFAYPHGSRNRAVVEAVRDAGFRVAFTTETGVVTTGSDPYQLPRMEIRRGDTGMRLRLRLLSARSPAALRRVATGLRTSAAARRGRGQTV